METDWTKHWEHYGNLFWKIWSFEITTAYKNLLKHAGLENPKILELGSGSGTNSLTVARTLKAKSVTLVDFNEKAFEISKRLFENPDGFDVRYLNKNILDLEMNEKFDLVHSEGLLEHFYGKDRTAIFKKHIDLCKNSGFVIMFVTYKNIPYTLFRRFSEIFGGWIWDEEPFSKKEIYGLCKELNLKILKVYASPFMHEIGILIKKGDNICD